MRVCVATDVNLLICNDRWYLPVQVSIIIKRYYDAFGPLVYFGRRRVVDSVGNDCEDVTEEIESAVTVSSLKEVYSSAYKKKLLCEIGNCDLVIVRCPGMVSYLAADCARRLKVPYFAESMACAWDAYWNHSLVGKALAPYMFLKMRDVVKHADYALYVTSKFLQKRYPCKIESAGLSDVLISDVGDEVLQKRLEKLQTMDMGQITLMTTAAIDVRYKGQEFVIKALPLLNKAGIRVKYVLIGGGDPTYLQGVAKACGVEEQVVFVGRKPLSEVLELLDEADIYVQPSLQEGLPRSVVEAMSRGCPCVGARTAGIPELLEDRFVVRRKSVKDIAEAISAFCNSPEEERIAVAQRNFREAQQFLKPELDARRNAYYQKVIEGIEG